VKELDMIDVWKFLTNFFEEINYELSKIGSEIEPVEGEEVHEECPSFEFVGLHNKMYNEFYNEFNSNWSGELRRLYEFDPNIYRDYVMVRATYSNITSLAYALIIDKPVKKISISSIHSPYNVHAFLLLRFLPSMYSIKGNVYSIYLSDIPPTSLSVALKYLYSAVSGSTHPIVLVAAHHGGYWSSLLSKMNPLITYISSSKRTNVITEYLRLPLIAILSGYSFKIRILF